MSTLPDTQLNQSLDGFWTIIFNAGQNFNGGVVFFRAGSIYGGDNSFYYLGTYKMFGRKLHGRVDCRAFAKNATNIFGTQLDHFVLDIEGNLEGDGSIAAVGSVPIAPKLGVQLRMVKRAQFS